MLEIICKQCGKKFFVRKYRVKSAKFCSRNCKHLNQVGKKAWNKGKKMWSEEDRKKISERKKKLFTSGWVHPLKGKPRPESVKQKLREANLGKKQSPETIEKAHVKLRGQKRSDAFRENLSNKRKGELNPAWLGGKRDEAYSVEWTETLRISIRERDRYTCQLCSKQQGDRVHAIHHIDYNKLNCNPDNLITLCLSCHMKTNTNRELWKQYFIHSENKNF